MPAVVAGQAPAGAGQGRNPAEIAVTAATFEAAPTGLELEAALQRLHGDRRLLCELLECLLEDYGTAITTLRSALRREKFTEARRLVHTLKGVAGSVGATPLQEAAAAVEQSLRQGVLPGETPLLALEAALAQVLASAAVVVREWRQDSVPPAPSTGVELNRTLHELLLSLERHALDAEELFQSIRQAMVEADPALPVARLERHIERLEFKAAGQLLRQLAPLLGIHLEED